tara:strand:+ start:1583 stop:1807 length:225 start_codon:yes stop_codon:yes gene_type:complete
MKISEIVSRKNTRKFVVLKAFLEGLLIDKTSSFEVNGITLDMAIEDLHDGEQGMPTDYDKMLEKEKDLEKGYSI